MRGIVAMLAVVTVALLFHFYSSRGIIVDGQTPVNADLNAIVSQLRVFRSVSGRLPRTEEGLHALVERPPDVQAWSQLFRALPLDPWSRPYQYRIAPERSDGFDVFSFGPDPLKDSDDIHYRAQ